MSENDQCQLVCDERFSGINKRFDTLETILDDMDKKLFKGNGKPMGVMLELHEAEIQTIKSRHKWVMSLLTGIIFVILGMVLRSLLF